MLLSMEHHIPSGFSSMVIIILAKLDRPYNKDDDAYDDAPEEDIDENRLAQGERLR